MSVDGSDDNPAPSSFSFFSWVSSTGFFGVTNNLNICALTSSRTGNAVKGLANVLIGGSKIEAAGELILAAGAPTAGIGAVAASIPAGYAALTGGGQFLTGVGQLYSAISGNQPSTAYADIASGLSTPVSTLLFSSGNISPGTYSTVQNVESMLVAPKTVSKGVDLTLAAISAQCP